MMTQPSSMMMLGFNVAVPLGSRAVTSISSTSTTGFRVKVRVGSNNRLSSVTTTTTRSSMYGWVRDMMSGNKGKTDSDVHAVLGKPLRPPNGKNWEAPLEEATFGLGWYVYHHHQHLLIFHSQPNERHDILNFATLLVLLLVICVLHVQSFSSNPVLNNQKRH